MRPLLLASLIATVLCVPASLRAQQAPAAPAATEPDAAPAPPRTRNGGEIFDAFLAGRADAGCDSGNSNPRWEQHFSRAPGRLADADGDVLPLFGYVVDQLREASLPTEFALIPFIESGYRPGARSGSGPAGLWQFVGATARNHKVAISKHYDGRLSAVDSTDAAVRYLKTLHGMFGGDWRLAVMAYNAGEYRVLQAMRQAGVNAQNADPAALPGLSKISYAYVEKLHALACVLDRAQHQGGMIAGLDREVPILARHTLPAGSSLVDLARAQSLEPGLIGRLNPALPVAGDVTVTRAVLAPRGETLPAAEAAAPLLAHADVDAPRPTTVASTAPVPASVPARRTHTVRTGDSAWSIAKRYGITVKTLLSSNGLRPNSVLRPGMVLAFEEAR